MVDVSEMIHEARKSRRSTEFNGTVLEYLNILESKEHTPKLAHERIYDLLIRDGVEVIKTEENPRLRRIYGKDTLKEYEFFKNDFFGIDKTLMKIVRYFHSAAMKGEESRQVLYLVGPVGAGKSSWIDSMKRLLEEREPVYAIGGCPRREDPLQLLKKQRRNQFDGVLGITGEGS